MPNVVDIENMSTMTMIILVLASKCLAGRVHFHVQMLLEVWPNLNFFLRTCDISKFRVK